MVNKVMGGALPLTSLNHISLVCRNVEETISFYTDVLGFIPVRRPGSFDFDGAWLFNYGIGIHLLQAEEPNELPKKTEINPKDKHISFQCESMGAVERKLKEMGIKYVQSMVEDGGVYVEQLFFHDPDGFMIEICNCDNLPVVPLVNNNGSSPNININACSRSRSVSYNMQRQAMHGEQQQQHQQQQTQKVMMAGQQQAATVLISTSVTPSPMVHDHLLTTTTN